MIYGNFKDISVEELNAIVDTLDMDISTTKGLSEYRDYIRSPLYTSERVRTLALAEGYKILKLYPCYYQGWEMDEWGLIVEKDGTSFRLETSHGSLLDPKECKYKKNSMIVLEFT